MVAGFAGPAGSQQFALARYNPDSSFDSDFGSGGLVETAFTGNAAATSVALSIQVLTMSTLDFLPCGLTFSSLTICRGVLPSQ